MFRYFSKKFFLCSFACHKGGFDNFVLCIFLIMETKKGDDSCYAPFLNFVIRVILGQQYWSNRYWTIGSSDLLTINIKNKKRKKKNRY